MKETKKLTLREEMKKHEYTSDFKLLERNPVIIRIDAKNFFSLPTNESLVDVIATKALQQTAILLSQEIKNCRFAFVISDEINLVLYDKKHEQTPMFNNRIQKLTSYVSSLATCYFNLIYERLCDKHFEIATEDEETIIKPVFFTVKAYNVPLEDVGRVILNRQRIGETNAVNKLASKLFDDDIVHKRSKKELVKLLSNVRAVESIPSYFFHGFCYYKKENNVVIDSAVKKLDHLVEKINQIVVS